MALGDFNPLTHSPEARQALCDEVLFAHKQNGTLKQHDWWAIAENALHFRSVHNENTVQYIIDADLDTRHVSILCAPNSHFDPYEIMQILRAAPVDGSTILAAYIYAVSDILEQHYSTACRHQNFHPFIKDNNAGWGSYIDGDGTNAYMSLLAKLWQETGQEFIFDAGRKQILYAALEADLEKNNMKPDWFIPATAFLPFAGRKPKTNLIVRDLEVYELPETALELWVQAPRTSGFLSRLAKRFSRH